MSNKNLLIIGVICIISAICLLGIFAFSNADSDTISTKLILDSNSTTIDENSTTFIIKGTADPDANVSITSKLSSIGTKYPKIDSNGNFYYYIKVPTSINNTIFTIEAKKDGEAPTTLYFTMKRNISNNSVNEKIEKDSSDISKYLGNSYTKIFHNSNCQWAKKISENNLVKFNERQKAVDGGYEPCKVCKP